jgi:DNA-binding FadR family transcriptional regulator
MSDVTSVSNTASAVSQQLLASLQAQMARYSQAANGTNSQASADYKALQAAIQSGNVAAAQVALSRLQRDDKAASPAAATSTSTSAAAQSWTRVSSLDAKA